MGKTIRDDKGRFARKQARIKKIKKFFISAFVLIAIFNLGKFYKAEYHYESPIVQAIEIEEPVEKKIERMKDSIINDLVMCESSVSSSENMGADNLVNFDPDNRQPGKSIASIGILKFKIPTLQSYWKIFYGEELTAKQATLKALDDEESKKLAKKIIFEDSGKAGNNWFNCFNKAEHVKKYNLKTRVEAVKLLVAEI